MNIHKTMLERLYNEYMVKDPMDGPVSLLTLEQVRDALKCEDDMSTHTPGPWGSFHPGPLDHGRRIFAGNVYIAFVGNSGMTVEQNEINARLIAAAPELLEALKELLGIVRIHSEATNNNFAWAEVEYAEEVIAKATGGKHDTPH
jgi:hypothetical protein